MNALLKGERDGIVAIESVKPKLTAGKRKIIDEQFDNSVQYKNTEKDDFNPKN